MRKGAEKLAKFLNAKQQGRLDTFFKPQEKKDDKASGSKAGGTAKGGKRKNVSYLLRFGLGPQILHIGAGER